MIVVKNMLKQTNIQLLLVVLYNNNQKGCQFDIWLENYFLNYFFLLKYKSKVFRICLTICTIPLNFKK